MPMPIVDKAWGSALRVAMTMAVDLEWRTALEAAHAAADDPEVWEQEENNVS